MKRFLILTILVCVILVVGCNVDNIQETKLAPTQSPIQSSTQSPTQAQSPGITVTADIIETVEPLSLSITLGEKVVKNGIQLNSGGDVDVLAVSIDGLHGFQTGNGVILTSADGNDVPDGYIQFDVDDDAIFKGSPVGRVRVEVDYLDVGTDTFILQYDALPTSSSGGSFTNGGGIVKTDSGEIKTAVFTLCDAYFANRVNGGDFRLSDNLDGAEVLTEVRVVGVPALAHTLLVDDFGANPLDDQPDSDAIQSVLDSTCSGDTVVFTSGRNNDDYQGYLINKTLFLTGISAKHNLTFTSSDPENHALLKATNDLKGYVVRLFARSRFTDSYNIKDIDFGYIDINGSRDERVCMGPDGVGNGEGDNWGSWLPECTQDDDPWCSPGNLAFDGFGGNVVVHDLIDQQGECGSGLAFTGKNGTIRNVTIDTVGDHVHASGCVNTDNDGDYGGWSDGITMVGPGHSVINNTIINPSDIGIVHFGGQDVTIANNTVKITAGNYGAFGAIALHPWDIADTSGVQVTGNTILSEGDTNCGGLHTGINIGAHMWGGACVQESIPGNYGNPVCSAEPDPAKVAPCSGKTCQLWLVLPAGKTFTLKDNSVTGAHVNYLIEGFLIEGQFVDENNISLEPRKSDWEAARFGCNGIVWGPTEKAAHHPALDGYADVRIHCER